MKNRSINGVIMVIPPSQLQYVSEQLQGGNGGREVSHSFLSVVLPGVIGNPNPQLEKRCCSTHT